MKCGPTSRLEGRPLHATRWSDSEASSRNRMHESEFSERTGDLRRLVAGVLCALVMAARAVRDVVVALRRSGPDLSGDAALAAAAGDGVRRGGAVRACSASLPLQSSL